MVQLLLRHGADFFSLIFFYCFSRRAAVVRLLLRHGADLNLPCWGLRRALHWAADRGQVACVKALVAAGMIRIT
jgi:ankyrin repeat protein